MCLCTCGICKKRTLLEYLGFYKNKNWGHQIVLMHDSFEILLQGFFGHNHCEFYLCVYVHVEFVKINTTRISGGVYKTKTKITK